MHAPWSTCSMPMPAYAKTGKSMRATFAHLYRLRDGKILSMEQYVDSAMVQQAITPN